MTRRPDDFTDGLRLGELLAQALSQIHPRRLYPHAPAPFTALPPGACLPALSWINPCVGARISGRRLNWPGSPAASGAGHLAEQHALPVWANRQRVSPLSGADQDPQDTRAPAKWLMIAGQKACRSAGERLVVNCRSITTSSSTASAPARRRSVHRLGQDVIR